ncbi:hypothetical protein [Streptomyces sp. RS2]|uniref:hypothetical protein n=1 Tax=Streptomyces sp. RS2 TaxID=1451205 RepID=UPI0027E33097|nr:hypothetical protein [Streptomyces sp. RS2]
MGGRAGGDQIYFGRLLWLSPTLTGQHSPGLLKVLCDVDTGFILVDAKQSSPLNLATAGPARCRSNGMKALSVADLVPTVTRSVATLKMLCLRPVAKDHSALPFSANRKRLAEEIHQQFRYYCRSLQTWKMARPWQFKVAGTSDLLRNIRCSLSEIYKIARPQKQLDTRP